MVVLPEGSPVSTEELWSSVRVTIGFLFISPSWLFQPLSIYEWRRPLCSRGPSMLQKDGGHCVLEDLQCCRMMEATVFSGTFNAAEWRRPLCSRGPSMLQNDGGHCVLGDLQCCRMTEATVFLGKFFVTLPQICASTRVLQTIPSTSRHGFCSDVHCHLWDLIWTGVHFQIMSNQAVETSQGWSMETGCSLIVKGLNIYVNNKIMLFFKRNLPTFKKTCLK
jgi:hypothetical protein